MYSPRYTIYLGKQCIAVGIRGESVKWLKSLVLEELIDVAFGAFAFVEPERQSIVCLVEKRLVAVLDQIMILLVLVRSLQSTELLMNFLIVFFVRIGCPGQSYVFPWIIQ